MDGQDADRRPRILVWNFSPEEKAQLDQALRRVKAPPAETIPPERGHLLVRDILTTEKTGSEPFVCDEKIVLFHNIPQQGVFFLIRLFKEEELPRPIFAVVTEHSINWPFSELVRHLVKERNAMAKRKREAEEPPRAEQLARHNEE